MIGLCVRTSPLPGMPVELLVPNRKLPRWRIALRLLARIGGNFGESGV